jgi:hypothetical protein
MPQLSHTFILRCWREPAATTAEGETAVWRFLLENPRTNERYTFASWEGVTAFIAQWVGREDKGAEREEVL